MKRLLTIDGRDAAIEIRSRAPRYHFRFNQGSECEAEVIVPEPAVYSVLIEGRSYEAIVEETAAGMVVTVDGHRCEVEVDDPREWSRKKAGQGTDGVQTIASPMPGKVVRVLAAAGDAVEVGQGIVVVEAMKMQNEMKAARAGVVRSISAKEGDTVTAGEVLATIG